VNDNEKDQSNENDDDDNINNINNINRNDDDLDLDEDDEDDKEEQLLKEQMGEEAYKRFLELKLKMNEAKNSNRQAVKEEILRSQNPNYEKDMKRDEYIKKKEQLKEAMLNQGVPEDKLYTLDTINKCEYLNSKMLKKKKNSTFGWDAFNVDSLYRAYKKRLKKMPFDKDLYDEQQDNPEIGVNNITEERKRLLINEVEEQ
jgi:hypothetical protein